MKIIDMDDISKKRAFSISFERDDGSVLLKVGASKIGVRKIYDQIGKEFPDRFRGGIIYSREQFITNLKGMSEIISDHFAKHKVFWAVKSAPLKELAQAAVEAGVGFDVGSAEELSLAIEAGADGSDICHTAPAKFDWDIDAIVKHGCISISDNLTELSLLDAKAGSAKKKIKVGIRINPAIKAETKASVSTGRMDCKFGIPEISDAYFERLKGFSNLDICILHMHIGHQISNPANYEQALESMVDVYRKFVQHGFKIEMIDVGGGFPYNYFDNPTIDEGADNYSFVNYVPYDLGTYISRMKAKLAKLLGDGIPTIAFEPGCLVTAGTAFALGYVLNTKEYPNGLRWAMCSVSVNDLWSKLELHNEYHDIHILDKDTCEMIPTGVGSTLCFSGDILTPTGVAINLPKDVRRGDMLMFGNVGAYALLGSGNFHNMPRLPVFVIDENLKLHRASRE